ncbi:MAG: SGNH/GDSL hydrolase family protein [Gemmataceae bacterium]
MIPLLTFSLVTALAAPPEPFALKDGDRLAWLGATLIEREQQYGRWEEALTQFNRGKTITFRNLGWSGDTVYGEARAAFDPPSKGYQRLVELTREVKPTVIAICYGSNESYEGDAGLERFKKGYNKLLNDLADTKARFILLSPLPFEPSPGYADDGVRNERLKKYVAVVAEIARSRKLEFVDLFGKASQLAKRNLTENGLHPNDEQYHQLVNYLFNEPVTIKSDDDLRAKIVAKNELFFHRWRPQNETYLFGFRKHEQGNNAKDIVAFDPLIAKAERDVQERLNAMPR